MKVSNVAWTNLIREIHKNGLDNVMLNNEELDHIEIILQEVLDEIQDEKVSREFDTIYKVTEEDLKKASPICQTSLGT